MRLLSTALAASLLVASLPVLASTAYVSCPQGAKIKKTLISHSMNAAYSAIDSRGISFAGYDASGFKTGPVVHPNFAEAKVAGVNGYYALTCIYTQATDALPLNSPNWIGYDDSCHFANGGKTCSASNPGGCVLVCNGNPPK